MSWNEFIVYTTNEAEEPVANILNDYGAQGVVIEDIQDVLKNRDNKFGEIIEVSTEHYPKKGICLKSYFYNDDKWNDKRIALQKKIEQLNEYDILLGDLLFQDNIVEEKDWENEWKKYFTIQKITDQLTIVPSWLKHEKQQDELIIHIDPGMAFGTGTHPTTLLSVTALEKYLHRHDSIIDVGVGSGILSIAACLLGADHVHAYDLDIVAINSAKMNAELNGMAKKITIEQQDLLKGNQLKAHIVVSNILAEILVDLVEDAWSALYNDGYFITSGIIKEKKQLVEDKLLENGFLIIETQQIEHWISIVAQKKE